MLVLCWRWVWMESWMESAEYPHTMSPTLGTNFLSWVLPSPWWEMAWALGPWHCGLITLKWQLLFGRKWCLFSMHIVVGKPTTKLHTGMDGEVQTSIRKTDQEKEAGKGKDHEGLYNKQEQILNIYEQGIQNWSSLSLTRYSFDYKWNKSNQTWNNFRSTLKTKSKYIYLRKIKVQ